MNGLGQTSRRPSDETNDSGQYVYKMKLGLIEAALEKVERETFVVYE